MRLVEFTYNKNRILVDADNVKTVIEAKPQTFDHTGMSRREYWNTRADRLVHKQTCLVFKVAAENRGQYVDQSFDEARAILEARSPSLTP